MREKRCCPSTPSSTHVIAVQGHSTPLRVAVAARRKQSERASTSGSPCEKRRQDLITHEQILSRFPLFTVSRDVSGQPDVWAEKLWQRTARRSDESRTVSACFALARQQRVIGRERRRSVTDSQLTHRPLDGLLWPRAEGTTAKMARTVAVESFMAREV